MLKIERLVSTVETSFAEANSTVPLEPASSVRRVLTTSVTHLLDFCNLFDIDLCLALLQDMAGAAHHRDRDPGRQRWDIGTRTTGKLSGRFGTAFTSWWLPRRGQG
jgi:hypothetical protein